MRGFGARRAKSARILLFDFQPVIVAHSQLVSQCLDVLGRCEATALQRRFLLAAYGDQVAIPVPRARAVAS